MKKNIWLLLNHHVNQSHAIMNIHFGVGSLCCGPIVHLPRGTTGGPPSAAPTRMSHTTNTNEGLSVTEVYCGTRRLAAEQYKVWERR